MELMDLSVTSVAYREYRPLLKLSYENVASYFDIFTSVDHQVSRHFFFIQNLKNFVFID